MKYNSKYDRWVSKDGLVYRYSKAQDKLVLCKQTLSKGYRIINCQQPKKGHVLIHRMVYETFIGEVPQGYEIDHINTIKDDNRLENLRCVTHKDNMGNSLSLKHISESLKGNTNAAGSKSIFGEKFNKHFGISRRDNVTLYVKEWCWYKRHNKVCRWEVEDKCKS